MMGKEMERLPTLPAITRISWSGPPGASRERHRCAGRTQPKPSFLPQRQHVVIVEATKATPPQNNSAILVASWQSTPISTNARATIDRDGAMGFELADGHFKA